MAVTTYESALDVERRRRQSAPRVVTLSDVLGRFPERSNLPVTSVSDVSPELSSLRSRAMGMFSDPALRQQATAIAAGEQQGAEPAGWRGLALDVLGNPAVKAAIKPLEILDIPRRVVVSTVDQINQAFTGQDPSFNEWMANVKNTSFGFGDINSEFLNDTYGKWGARIVGFLGDVAFDPLTYLSFGASKAAKVLGASGRKGRIALAQALIDKGVDTERAMQAARRGRHILTADELQKVGLDRAGVYFMGKRLGGERFTKAVMGSTSRTRLFVGDALRGEKVMRLFDPQDATEARRAILSGTAPVDRAADYFNMVTARNLERAAFGSSTREGAKRMLDLLNRIDADRLESVRRSVYRVMEKSAEASSPEELDIANRFEGFLKWMWDSVDTDYKLIDPDGGFKDITNYFPHLRTREAIRYMKNPDNSWVAELKQIIDNPVETLGVFKHRMKAGDRFFGRVLTDEDIAGGVQRLNEIARVDGGLKFDFFETDVVDVVTKYVGMWAEQKGVAAYMQHLFKTGTAERLAGRMAPDESVVKSAMEKVAKEGEKFTAAHAKVVAGLSKVRDDLLEFSGKAADNLAERASQAAEFTDMIDQEVLDKVRARDVIRTELSSVYASLLEARSAYSSLFDSPPLLLTAMREELDDALDEVQRISAWAQSTSVELGDDFQRLDSQVERLATLDVRLDSLRKNADAVDNLITSILKGERATGKGLKSAQSKSLRSALRGALDMKGGMEAAVKSLPSNEWWSTAMGEANIAVKDIAGLTVEQVDNIVANAARGSSTVREMRMATLWLIAREQGNPAGMESVRPLLDLRADGLLARAATADSWFRKMAKNEKDVKKWAKLEAIEDNVRIVRDEIDAHIREYAAARKLLNNMPLDSRSSAMAARVVPADQLATLLTGEYAPLQRLFADLFEEGFDPRLGDSIESLMDANLSYGGKVDAEDVVASTRQLNEITFGEFRAALESVIDSGTARYWDIEVATKGEASMLLPKNRPVQAVQESTLVERNVAGPSIRQGRRTTRTTRQYSTEEQVFDRPQATIYVDDAIDEIDNLWLDDFTPEVIDRIVADATSGLAEVSRSMRKELEQVGLIRRGRRGKGDVERMLPRVRVEVDKVRDELRTELTQLWFATSVNERMNAIADVLAGYGMVPSKEMYRRVVNSVAGDKAAALGATADAAAAARSALFDIEERLGSIRFARRRAKGDDLSVAATPDDARKMIRESLRVLEEKNPAAAMLLRRNGGDRTANDLKKRFIALGGTTQSGERRALGERRRATGVTTLTGPQRRVSGLEKKMKNAQKDAEKAIAKLPADVRAVEEPRIRAELKQAMTRYRAELKQAKSELEKAKAALPDKAAADQVIKETKDLARRRKKFVKEELKPWYKAMQGTTTEPNLDEVRRALDESAARGLGWDEDGSSIGKMLSWVQMVQDSLTAGNRSSARTARWLKQAADPFVDVDQIILDPNRYQMLPSSYANWLLGYASILDDEVRGIAGDLPEFASGVDRLGRLERETAASLQEMRAAEAAAATAVGDAAVGLSRLRALRGERNITGLDFGSEAAIARKARAAAAEYLALKNSPDYAIAAQRKGEHDVLTRLAMFDGDGGDIFVYRSAAQVARDEFEAGGVVFWQPPDVNAPAVQVDAGWFENGGQQGGYLFRQENSLVDGGVKAVSSADQRVRAMELLIEERKVALRKARRGKNQAKIAAADNALKEAEGFLSEARRLKEQGREKILSSNRTLSYDGQGIRFSPAEWRSLWLHGASPDELRADAASLRMRLGSLRKEQEQLGRAVRAPEMFGQIADDARISRNQFVREGEEYWRDRAAAAVGPRDAAVAAADARASRRGKALEDLIDETQRLLNQTEIDLAATDKVVRDAALQKVVWIRQAIKEGRTNLDSIERGMAGKWMPSADVSFRQQELAEMWAATAESAVLERMDELASSAQVEFYNRVRSDAVELTSLARNARDKARAAAKRFGTQQVEFDETYRRATQNVEGMGAAAGQDFAGMLEEGVRRARKEGAGDTPISDVFETIANAGRAARPPDAPLTGKPRIAANQIQRNIDDMYATSLRSRIREKVSAFDDANRRLRVLDRQTKELQRELDIRTAERNKFLNEEFARSGIKDLEQAWVDVTDRMQRAQAEFDEAVLMRDEMWAEVQGEALEANLKNVEVLMATLPPSGDTMAEMRAFIDEAQILLEEIRKTGGKVDAKVKVLVGEKNKIAKLLTTNRNWWDVTKAQASLIGASRQLEAGWTSLASIGLPNTVMREELWKMLQSMKRLNQPAFTRELGKFMSSYTEFFKAYATLSPGFHVRNAMSNTFMLVAAGSDVMLFRKSFGLARGYMRAFWDNDLDKFFARMSPQEREIFDAALRATDAAGGGRTMEALQAFSPKRSRLKENVAIRTSGRVGDAVEFTSRFMLAYDTIVQGMASGAKRGQGFTPDELFNLATERVKKYLFDYVDRGVGDEAMQTIIPFWLWMSRNLPLQLMNQWTNPKAYAMYGSLMRNIGLDDDDDVVPSWLKENGAVKVADNWYLSPDFGFNRLNQQVAEFSDPMRLLSYMNPALRVPLELTGGRRLYNAVPFKDAPQEVTGGPLQPLLEQLLRLTGQAQRTADGKIVTDDKVNYALLNTLPFLSQAERLVPATDPYKARQLGSWLSYFGVPVRQVTDQMRESEIKRREYELRDLKKFAEQLGFTA